MLNQVIDAIVRSSGIRFPTPVMSYFNVMASGWSDWYGNGTVSHDSTDFVVGAGSIKVVMSNDNSSCGMEFDLPSTFDWSAKNFSLWVKCSDWSKVSQALVIVSTSGSFASRFDCDLGALIQSQPNNEWVLLTFTRDNFVDAAGTPDWSTANKLIIKCSAGVGETPTLWTNGFGVYGEGSASYVSVVFDDGWESAYTQGKLKMDEYGMKGNAFLIRSYIGETDYMTQDMVDNLARSGWDISAHSNMDLSTLTDEQLDTELKGAKKYSLDHGYKGGDFYAYPLGVFNNSISNYVEKYFSGARTIEHLSNPTSYVVPRNISAYSITNVTSTATIEALIDDAIANKKWLVLLFHKIVTSPSVSTEYSIANFGTIVDYLNTVGANVLPMSEVLRRL